MTTVHALAVRNSRCASEFARSARGCQQIAEAADRLDDLDPELLAHAADEDLDRVGIAIEVLVVEMLHKLGARDHASGMVHQISEQTIFMRRELDRIAVDGHPSGARIEPHRTAVELALGVAGGAPQQRAHPGQHLFEMERLGHIVVGTGIEALDLVAPAVAGGEQKDRHAAAGASPGFEHGEPVHLGQTDIENYRVIRLGLAEIVAFLPVEGPVDHVARIAERGGKLPIEVGIVLDDQETHRSSAPASESEAHLLLRLIRARTRAGASANARAGTSRRRRPRWRASLCRPGRAASARR